MSVSIKFDSIGLFGDEVVLKNKTQNWCFPQSYICKEKVRMQYRLAGSKHFVEDLMCIQDEHGMLFISVGNIHVKTYKWTISDKVKEINDTNFIIKVLDVSEIAQRKNTKRKLPTWHASFEEEREEKVEEQFRQVKRSRQMDKEEEREDLLIELYQSAKEMHEKTERLLRCFEKIYGTDKI